MRIANQVIEEVDEQATITSMASKKPEVRPFFYHVSFLGDNFQISGGIGKILCSYE